MLNINRACQTCHKWPESDLKERVEAIQERTQNMYNLAMDALVEPPGGYGRCDFKLSKNAAGTIATRGTARPPVERQGTQAEVT